MKCPFCNHEESSVIDSRVTKEGDIIRRRRECATCKERFTTYERVEEIFPLIIKKDDRREPYDRKKLVLGFQKACEKRPVSMETIEEAIRRIEKGIQELGEKEIPAKQIGERVMRELHRIDPVAYVRFASVYREFKDINEFMDELKGLLKEGKRE